MIGGAVDDDSAAAPAGDAVAQRHAVAVERVLAGGVGADVAGGHRVVHRVVDDDAVVLIAGDDDVRDRIAVGLVPDLDAEGAVGCDPGKARDDVEPDDVVGEDVGVAVVVEDAAAVEVGDLERLDRAVVRVVVEREADRAGTGLGAVDLDQGLAGVAGLRRPVDGDRVGERRQRLEQRDRLLAGPDGEVDRHRRIGGEGVGLVDRIPEGAHFIGGTRWRVVIGRDVEDGREELPGFEELDPELSAEAGAASRCGRAGGTDAGNPLRQHGRTPEVDCADRELGGRTTIVLPPRSGCARRLSFRQDRSSRSKRRLSEGQLTSNRSRR